MIEPLERLRNAIREGDLPITKRLLARFPELWLNTDCSNQGWSNLHLASYHGNYLICYHLVSFINKRTRDIEQEYALLDLLTFDGLSVLHLPIINHYSQTLHYLLQEFPGKHWVNHPGGKEARTPLHFACVYGFKEGIKLLLEFGADWAAQDSNGNTCFHLCFEYGNYECLLELLKTIIVYEKEKGNDINIIEKVESMKNSQGWPTVDYSYSFEFMEKYKFLKQELYVFEQELADSNYSHSDTNLSDVSLSLTKGSVISFQDSQVPTGTLSGTTGLNKTQLFVNMRKPSDSGHYDRVGSKLRAHSVSLPSATSGSDQLSSRTRNHVDRRRSSTLYNSVTPNPLGATNRAPSGSPHTPIPQNFVHKTPSLKSVTISSLVRGNGSDSITSPQSSVSINSLNSGSPTHTSSRRRSINNFAMTPLQGSYPSMDNRISMSPLSSSERNTASQLKQGNYQPVLYQDSEEDESTISSGDTNLANQNHKIVIQNTPKGASSFSSDLSSQAKSPSPTPTYHGLLRRQISSSTLHNPTDNESDHMKGSNISSISFNRVR